MSIIRSPRPESNFYILDKRISEDARLSWSARGMLIFLLGKPDHWKVNIEALINCTGESCRPAGKTAVYAIITELLQAGYMTRQKHADGTLDYYVHEVPQSPVDKGGEPDSGNPNLGNPNLGNPPLVSTEKAVKTQKAARTEKAIALPAKFEVTDEIRLWAKENNLTAPDDLIDAFRDYHLSKGSTFKDWNAAFRTWIRNDKRFSSPKSKTTSVLSSKAKSLEEMDYSQSFF
ncbi:hypothetical protein [Caballeronia sp. NCTM1]|uniref:hypothetical protein n=1 Tax=Caballeronia sp. NCTM1 TaxID=2921753 RepID=UPI0020297E79|nr:hypothetical protein [Caballeronia sp. NCTM1]